MLKLNYQSVVGTPLAWKVTSTHLLVDGLVRQLRRESFSCSVNLQTFQCGRWYTVGGHMTMSRSGLAIVSSSDKEQLQTQIQIRIQIERQIQILKDKHKIMTMIRPGLAIVSSSENERMTD